MISSLLFLLVVMPLWGPLQPLIMKMVLVALFFGMSAFQKPLTEQPSGIVPATSLLGAQHPAASVLLAEYNTNKQGEPSMPEALSETQIQNALQDLPGWRYESHALHKDFQFKDFREAIGFIVHMSFYAEGFNHHPELFNVYNRVTIKLTTHDAGNKVTALDLKLARAIETINGSHH